MSSPASPPSSRNPLRRLYDWVLSLSTTPYALAALVAIAFAESSFFPIPPDVLLIAMAIAAPSRSFTFAAWCTVGSVVGGVAGYGIGLLLMTEVGCPVVDAYHGQAVFDRLAVTFQEYGFWAVLVAAVTPIPYKIFTITAGAVSAPFVTFLVASLIGRATRFFAVAALLYFFGPPVKRMIDKWFDVLSVAFVVLLIGGFVAIRYVSDGDDHAAEVEAKTDSTFVEMCGPA